MTAIGHLSRDSRQRARGCIAATVLAVALAGCGGSSDSSQVTNTIKTFLTAVANGDGTTACDQLTTTAALTVVQTARGLGAANCPQAFHLVSGDLGGNGKQLLLDVHVISLHVSGNTATANLRGFTGTFQLSKTGGRWFIVGTEVSGLLNAFNGGGGGGQEQTVSAAEKSAEKAVKANPASPAAWAQLVQARWTGAGQGSNYNSATQTFSAAGKKELAQAGQAWQRYLQLTNGKDPKQIAVLAGRIYASVGNYAAEASAWQVESASAPGAVKGYECLALSAYAAGQTRKGDLALDKALTLVPKDQRKTLTTNLQAAKTNPKLATQC